MDRKEIEKLEGDGSIELSGFSGNISQYGESYILFPKEDNGKVYSISGFAGKQFSEIEEKLKGKDFILYYESRYSDKYDKDYTILTKVRVLKDRSKLDIEYEE